MCAVGCIGGDVDQLPIHAAGFIQRNHLQQARCDVCRATTNTAGGMERAHRSNASHEQSKYYSDIARANYVASIQATAPIRSTAGAARCN